jgi:hypothetical protein
MDDMSFDWVQVGATWHIVCKHLSRIGDVDTACGRRERGFRLRPEPPYDDRCAACEKIRIRLMAMHDDQS